MALSIFGAPEVKKPIFPKYHRNSRASYHRPTARESAAQPRPSNGTHLVIGSRLNGHSPRFSIFNSIFPRCQPPSWKSVQRPTGTAGGGSHRHALPLPRGKGTGTAKSPYAFEKTLKPRIASKQFAGCLHQQVRLVPRQHIGCWNRF